MCRKISTIIRTLDFEGKIVGKVKLICIVCSRAAMNEMLSLGAFKRWLDEHHLALLRLFVSLALLYKTPDLLSDHID